MSGTLVGFGSRCSEQHPGRLFSRMKKRKRTSVPAMVHMSSFSRVGGSEVSLKYRHPIQVDLCASRFVKESALGGSPVMEGQARSAAYVTSIAYP